MRIHTPPFIPALLILGLMTACGPEKLDRDKAATLIKEFYGYPRVEIDRISFPSKPIIEAGWGAYFRNFSLQFRFNEMAEPYLFGSNGNAGCDIFGSTVTADVVANCNDFIKVTGIAMGEPAKTAKVEFMARRLGITPLGELAGRKEGDTLNYSVTMQLYDDGWRITAKKLNNIKPEAYPFFNQDGTYKQPASIN